MATQANGDSITPVRPKQLAFSLPTSPDIKINLQISVLTQCTLVVVSGGRSTGSSAGGTNLGSLVYALPDRLNPNGLPISTALYSRTSGMDFITRLAKVLAKKLQKPIYVGGDVKFGLQEDESLALRGCVDVLMDAIDG